MEKRSSIEITDPDSGTPITVDGVEVEAVMPVSALKHATAKTAVRLRSGIVFYASETYNDVRKQLGLEPSRIKSYDGPLLLPSIVEISSKAASQLGRTDNGEVSR